MNRLADASSPYLLQHRDNPVDWFEWGEEAFAEARRRDVPILLSIGYAACHWCHVMAHESFEDPATAELMNGLFVNIKLDREERPDVDQLYMSALHATGAQGGWPLTMFLTPDRVPFWGGTYFPPSPHYGQPAFTQVLKEISRLWRDERERLLSSAARLMSHLEHKESEAVGLSAGLVDRAAERILEIMDPVAGGTRGAPKFPNAPVLETLERAGDRGLGPAFHAQVDLALTRMSLGGIYDHVGGGYCRYSVDAEWLVPHFEKMLYDNAQLIALLTRAWLRTGSELFRVRIDETIAWLEREMLQPGGGFASSLDADSEGKEGAFYVWTPAQVAAVLGADAGPFCALYDITAHGNWEDVSIPNLSRSPDLERALAPEAAAWREQLRVSRETRPRPGLDDKILADWNGLLIAALAGAATVFGRPHWLALAQGAYRFVSESMARDERLGHSWRADRLVFPGFATDHAALASAALALHEATGDAHYLSDAEKHLETLERHHRHPGSGLLTLAPAAADDLPLSVPATLDEAVPNAHGVALAALVRLALITGRTEFRERADALFSLVGAPVMNNVFGHASVLNALDLRLGAIQIVLIGSNEDPAYAALQNAAQHIAPHRRVLTVAAGTVTDPNHPAFGKQAVEGKSTAYVCIGQQCSLPVTQAEDLKQAVSRLLSR